MNILIRGANWIGDAVMTIPAMREIRRLFPESRITLLTRSWAEGIFRDADFVDEILTFESRDRSFANVFSEARRLRTGEFDLAVLFPNSFGSAAVVRLAGIPRRLGYASEGRSILLSDAIRRPRWKDERHQSLYYLKIAAEVERRLLGTETAAVAEATISLSVSESRRASAQERLDDAGLDLAKPIVAFGAGSTNSMAKRWGEMRFARLAELLQKRLDANILLLGAENETGASAQVSAFSDADIVDLTGATSIDEVTAILSVADLFVSNDMGLAHVSAAVGTPTVVIFGPTNDTVTRPLGESVAIVRERVECSPCMLRECPIDHRCMTRVSPERVFEAAIELFSE